MPLSDYWPTMQAAGEAFGVDPSLLYAIGSRESGGDPSATSDQGAQGLMQIIPSTAAKLGVKDPYSPEQSIYGAAKLVAQLRDHFGGSIPLAVAAYHGGLDQKAWGPKTQAYQSAVLNSYKAGLTGDGGPTSDADDAEAYTQLTGQAPSWAPAARQGMSSSPAGASAPSAAPASQADADLYRQLTGVDPDWAPGKAGGQATAPPAPGSPQGGIQAGDGSVVNSETGAAYNAAQTAAAQRLIAAGTYDPNGPAGSIHTPYVQTDAKVTPTQPGAYWIDLQGQLHQVAGKPITTADALEAGFGQGVRDVGATVNDALAPVDRAIRSTPVGGAIMSGIDNLGVHSTDLTTAGEALKADRDAYDARYGGDWRADLARVGGNLVATAPIMAAGGEALGAGGALLSRAAPAAEPVVNFLTGAAGGGRLVPTMASKAAAGALQGGAANALLASTSDKPLGQQVAEGALTGGVLGSAAAPVAAGWNRLLAGVSPEVAALGRSAVQDYGIPLRASQVADSPTLSFLDKTAIPKAAPAQQAAFNRAVSQTIGENSEKLTPQVMAGARDRIGQVFDDVAGRTDVKVDDPMLNDLADVGAGARESLTEQEAKIVDRHIGNILDVVEDDGMLTGEQYQALTKRGSPLWRLQQNSNPNLSTAGDDLRGALDAALLRSAAPEDVAALRGARSQWKNLRLLEPLVSDAGVEGDINPAKLLGAVKRSYGDHAYTGAGDIGQIAEIGRRFLVPQDVPSVPGWLPVTAKIAGAAGGMLGGHALGLENNALLTGLSGLGGAGLEAVMEPVAGGFARLAGRAVTNAAVRNRLLDGYWSDVPRGLQMVRGVADASGASLAPNLGVNQLLGPSGSQQRQATRP